ARLFRVIDLVHEALTINIPTTKRDIFYKDVPLFKSQSVVDDLVDDLAASLGVSRGDLNVRASPKGLFCGSGLTIHLRSGGVIRGNDGEGALIPAAADISQIKISMAISWVLIVEKEAAFQTFCRTNLASNSYCPGSGVIITGKGYPDLATRQLVSYLSNTLGTSVPLLALVDADAYGLDILSVYKFGSQSMSHESSTATAPRIIWLGVWTSELPSLGVDKDNLIPLTVHDHKKARMLKRHDMMMPPQWRKELTHMLHTRRKAEIEIISSASKFSAHCNTSQQSILHSEPKDEVATSDLPPIVKYLIPKLKFWVEAF
ncbi:DNA topoisomerase IV, alpha subunit, partial [Ramaria rubella]